MNREPAHFRTSEFNTSYTRNNMKSQIKSKKKIKP